MTRRGFSTPFHFIPLLLALACGDATQRAETASTENGFKVALLTPGPISDQAWNSGAYQGLLRIRDSLGASVSHIQTRTPADFEENFRHYGAEGYQLVFGHGFEFQDAAERVAPYFPRTVFITTSGNRVAPNVSPMVFGFEDPSYVAGVLAGSLTRSDVIGAIGGTEIPPVRSSFAAFEAGARAVNPDVRVLVSYVGNWEDASAGKEQAIAQIRQGVDYIFQNADAAGLGIFQAAREARNVAVFGANIDQNAVAPDVIIGSVVIDLPHAFLSIAREVKDGRFRARVVRLGSTARVTRFVLNPAWRARVPPAILARVDSTEQRIIRGELRPPRIEFVDTASTDGR
ncbi:MAG TPA: BMP family protein [Gemmatimonadaceae bacterium]|nr:BMP family protein [Gemmatimonadaceae bacterium]